MNFPTHHEIQAILEPEPLRAITGTILVTLTLTASVLLLVIPSRDDMDRSLYVVVSRFRVRVS